MQLKIFFKRTSMRAAIVLKRSSQLQCTKGKTRNHVKVQRWNKQITMQLKMEITNWHMRQIVHTGTGARMYHKVF